MARSVPNPKPKTPSRPNGSILTFFKKIDDQSLFVGTSTTNVQLSANKTRNDSFDSLYDLPDNEWESAAAAKRRKLDQGDEMTTPGSPPLTEEGLENDTAQKEVAQDNKLGEVHAGRGIKSGPFVDVSDSEDESEEWRPSNGSILKGQDTPEHDLGRHTKNDGNKKVVGDNTRQEVPPPSSGDFEGFEEFEDQEEDIDLGEESYEQRWSQMQRELEVSEQASNWRNAGTDSLSCPICCHDLSGVMDTQATQHVNDCLDGKPTTVLPIQPPQNMGENAYAEHTEQERPARPPRPGQRDPFSRATLSKATSSAFSKIMASNAEDLAWKEAAESEIMSRGKQSYERTCPFYKILPGFSICVDAFRYGAVEGCQAYFLSHFHSDHYIGLTASWKHGPIYCSRITGNLVRQQLKVLAKWVVDLDFEVEREVPGTNGVRVTMIPANHCPGSSLFLFEKAVGRGSRPKVQRILHCGDFRACRAHIEHPLLKPNVIDSINGQNKEQHIDICYLDTTYLNPKYAFPKQESVVQACADICVKLKNEAESNAFNANAPSLLKPIAGIKSFFSKDEASATTASTSISPTNAGPSPTKLLVVIGTYSIGKERICIAIAHALGSKIFASPAKRAMCACLEDAELSSLLTPDPRAAQVHMTPLFDLRADTLDDYLAQYAGAFSHVVGFRPSGWNYRGGARAGRNLDNPAVADVLRGEAWKTDFTMADLVPQRGSNKKVGCYGVPYSEHSSFRELTAFCCALRIGRVIPTVNVGSAKSRERMRAWVDRWEGERRRNGLFHPDEF